MKSGGNHLPLSQIKMRGKITGKEWSCGCCGYQYNVKKEYLKRRLKQYELLNLIE